MATALGIECGATSSTALLSWPNGSSKLFKFEPANYLLVSLHELETKLLNLSQVLSKEDEGQLSLLRKVGIAMPGLFNSDKPLVEDLVRRIWPGLDHVWVGQDLDTAMACLQSNDDADTDAEGGQTCHIHCLVLSGTGSCVYGVNTSTSLKIGGHGHVIGDGGSGYAIALFGLRESVKEFDRTGESTLFNDLKKSLNLPGMLELVRWSVLATKTDIASLAPVVMNAWKNGDSLASRVVQRATEDLATDLYCLVQKLAKGTGSERANVNVKIGFTGSVLVENPDFKAQVISKFEELAHERGGLNTKYYKDLENTVKGALIMLSKFGTGAGAGANANDTGPHSCKALADLELNEEELYKKILPIPTSLGVTECRNLASWNLDTMSIDEAIDLWLAEESSFYPKIGEQKMLLEKLIMQVTATFRDGGRLFYTGSGTSGRLGILDASECPPTFSTPPHMVQGITAGGKAAVFSSMEGAEDSVSGGMRVIDEHGITAKDTVIGIACSGRTPFVWGSLYRAKTLGAFTAFLTFNPNQKLQHEPDIVLAFNIGPEILTGSTRLKSGSATKCILNMITTLSMVQLGKCLENLMVDVHPCNNKLRDRALRITMAILNGDSPAQHANANLTTAAAEEATTTTKFREENVHEILKLNNYDIKKTVRQLRKQRDEDVILTANKPAK